MRQTGTFRTHSHASRRTLATALTALVVFSLAGCQETVPKPTTSSQSQTTSVQGKVQNSKAQNAPELSESQVTKIETAVLQVLAQADKSKDSAVLSSRVQGPELSIRASQLSIVKSTGTADSNMTVPDGIRQIVVPTNSGWPRFVYVITSVTSDMQSERLLVLNQDTPQSSYKLWGLVRLLPGAQSPEFATPDIGSSMGSTADKGLKATPQDAVKMYASVLGDPSSASASQFESDDFRKNIQELSSAVDQAMKANAGTQKQTFTYSVSNIKVMQAADGGDLAVAQIDSTWERDAGGGRQSLPASDAEEVLFGKTTPTSKISVSYVNVVALYIPPADSTGKIRVIGAERQPVKVSALK